MRRLGDAGRDAVVALITLAVGVAMLATAKPRSKPSCRAPLAVADSGGLR